MKSSLQIQLDNTYELLRVASIKKAEEKVPSTKHATIKTSGAFTHRIISALPYQNNR